MGDAGVRGAGGGVAIPRLRGPETWRAVPIHECGEPLVALSAFAPERIAVDARYSAAGYPGAVAECYARAGVARRLAEAAAVLPAGWRLVVFDAWRPLAVQQHLFDGYVATLRSEAPDATQATLQTWAARYVAPPSVDPRCPSPHATGGAIDLSLLDADGAAVAMGTAFDAFDARAQTRYFEQRAEAGEWLDAEAAACLRHRRILFHCLRGAGFTNYPEEWWHFDAGNQFWGRIVGVDAIYGLAAPVG